jgi:hypothetical protein
MPQGFIPLSTQMDFLWNEVQGKEKSGFGKFLTANASTPEDYATLWDKYYERSGGAGDEKARNYANSVYAAMAGGTSNPGVIPPNAKFAYGYLTQKGLTPQQAAGITGRLMAESYQDMNPDARNTLAGGQGTYGIAQWRGSRMEDLADFAGVDVSDITSLPATTASGGLLTSNQGGQDMANRNQPPYMMGGEETYNAPNMRQPARQPQQQQQGGMRGLLSTVKDRAMAVDPNTGLTGLEQFAVALDPLIMSDLRGGAAIEKRGAQRVAAGNRNKTVEMLRARGRDDLADMVERGMISPTDAAGQLLAAPKDDRTAGIKEYQQAVSQGFKGTFLEYKTALQEAGATKVIPPGQVNAEDELRKKLMQKKGEGFSKMLDAGSASASAMTDLNILQQLAPLAPSGPLTGRIAEAFPEFNDVASLRQSIVKRVAPTLRVEGSGATSDLEFNAMLNSLGSLRNTPEANQAIIAVMQEKAKYNMDRAAVIRAYETNKIDLDQANNQLAELDGQSRIPAQVQLILDRYAVAVEGAAPSGAASKRWNPSLNNGDGGFE